MVDELGPLVNWVALGETHSRPAVVLGTSSDRIGTPRGRAFYVTASKDLSHETGLPIGPYAGLTFGTFDDTLRFIGGLNVAIREGVSGSFVFDGVHGHAMLNARLAHGLSFTFLMVRGKHPGASLNVGF